MPDYNELLKHYATNSNYNAEDPSQSVLSPFADPAKIEAERAAASPAAGGFNPIQAGGYLLTKTLAGITAPGQYIQGAIKYIEDWSKSGQDFSSEDMFNSAHAQFDRIAGSRNLAEIGQNSETGADLLKNLGGGVGDFFKQDTGLAKTASFVLGLGVDIVTDPLTYLSGGTTKAAELLAVGGTKVARGLLEAGVKTGITTAERADVFAPKLGSILHNGVLTFGASVVPQSIAVGARELVAARIGKAAALINNPATDEATRNKISGLMTWLVSKTSTADGDMVRGLNAYASMQHNLPIEVTLASRSANLMLSKLPKAQRIEAQQALTDFIHNRVTNPPLAAVIQQKLTDPRKLGGYAMSHTDLQRVVGGYTQASLRLGNLGMEAGLAKGLLDDHLKRSYALFQTDSPDIFQAQLTRLDHENLPPRYWLNNGEVADKLQSMLKVGNNGKYAGGNTAGITAPTLGVKPLSTAQVNGLPGQAPLLGVPGSSVQGGYTAFGQATATVTKATGQAPGVATAGLRSAIDNLDRNIAKLDPSDARVTKLQAKRDELAGQLGPSADAGMANSARATLEQQVQNYTDLLANVKPGSRRATDLETKRAAAQRQLAGNAPSNSGLPAGAPASMGAPGVQLPGNPAVAAAPFTMTQQAALAQNKLLVKSSLQHIGFTPAPPQLSSGEYSGFIDELGKWWGQDPHLAPHLIALADGTPAVAADAARIGMANPDQYAGDVAALLNAAKKKTIADVTDFVTQHGTTNGWSPEKIAAVNENTVNSIVHIAGGAELAAAVRNGRSDLKTALDKNASLVRTVSSATGIDADVFASRELIEPYRELFGQIKEFSPAAVIGAKEQAKAIAQQRLFQTMVDQNIVHNDILPNMKPGFVQLKGAEYGPADGMFINHGNYTALKLAMTDADNLNLPRFVTRVSGMIKRNLLIYDVSSTVSQWLGNLDFLASAGFHPLGFNAVDSGVKWHRAITSLTRFDDDYQEAIKSGLDVQMHALDDNTMKELGSRIAADSINRSTGKTENVLQRLGNIWSDTMTRASAGVGNIASANTKRQLNSTALTDDARSTIINTANAQERLAHTILSPSAMFGLPDQATRMFAFQRGKDKLVKELVENNPELKPYTKGTKIDFDTYHKEAEAAHDAAQAQIVAAANAAATPPAGWPKGTAGWAQPNPATPVPFDAKPINDLRQAYQTGLQDSAEMANEVALNYHDVPLAAEFLARSGVIPFIKFSWKSNGRLMEWAAEKPAVFAKYARIQREAGAAFVGDEDARDRFQEGLPDQVKNAMNVPLPVQDSLGRQVALDLGRWVPYAAYAQAAAGTVQGNNDEARSPALTDMFGSPILDFFINTHDDLAKAKTNGQDWAAAVAQNVAKSFFPSSIVPGSRQMTQLAASIRQSVMGQKVDGSTYEPGGQWRGNADSGVTDPNMQAQAGYAELPQRVAAALNPAPGTPTNNTYLPSNIRPSKAPEMQLAGQLIPGFGVASDAPRALIAAQKAQEFRQKDIVTQINSIVNRAGNRSLTADENGSLQKLYEQQAMLTRQLTIMNQKLNRPQVTTLGN